MHLIPNEQPKFKRARLHPPNGQLPGIAGTIRRARPLKVGAAFLLARLLPLFQPRLLWRAAGTVGCLSWRTVPAPPSDFPGSPSWRTLLRISLWAGTWLFDLSLQCAGPVGKSGCSHTPNSSWFTVLVTLFIAQNGKARYSNLRCAPSAQNSEILRHMGVTQ